MAAGRACGDDGAMNILFHGRLRAVEGRGADLIAILSEQGDAEPMPGNLLYLVSTDPEDPDAVWITEAWESEEAHQASLQMPSVRSRIERAVPILDMDGMTHQQLVPVAGLPA